MGAAAACPASDSISDAAEVDAPGDALDAADRPDAPPPTLAERLCQGWADHPDSPLIEAPGAQFLIGDPTVLLPEESPDGLWHLFANSLDGIHHHSERIGLATLRLPAAP